MPVFSAIFSASEYSELTIVVVLVHAKSEDELLTANIIQ